jgi:ribonuclease HII
MRIVGIDEAGYGPLLGPLVVTAVGLDVPNELVGRSLWSVLRASVTPKAGRSEPRLVIADSKKLYRGADGLSRLEVAALAWLAAKGRLPGTLLELLSQLCPASARQLSEYPWYGRLDVKLPAATSVAQIETQSNALRRDLKANRIRSVGLWSEALPAGHYNQLIDKTRNKAVLLFGVTTRLIQTAAADGAPSVARILVDRQGGRGRYARPLMTAFGDRHLAVVEESPERSAYELVRGQSKWQVEFAKSGEDRHLPIALASIFSKYVRELLMMCFNRFWQSKLPGLTPTEGYYVDAKRFLEDIQQVITDAGVNPRTLVRQR